MREAQIDERDRKDYFTPSTSLFFDYCASVASRYGIDVPDQILQCEVTDLEYSNQPELSRSSYHNDNGHGDNKIFTLTTSNGEMIHARTVVLAIGPGHGPPSADPKNIPWPLSGEERTAACHSMEIREFPSESVKEKIRGHRDTNIVIVGGGLSSAQIADMAVRKGIRKVWLLMRSGLKGIRKPPEGKKAWLNLR